MSISSLKNLTVPLAGGGQSPEGQALLMPKLQYRFRVSLENFGVSAGEVAQLTKQVVDVTRPSLDFEDIELHLYNSKVRLAGRHSWNDLTLNLRDDSSGYVQKLVGEQLQKQFDFFEQSSAASGIDYKFTTRIEVLDGGNGAYEANVLETWEIYGCYLKNANYNNLAYNSNEPATVALTIRYDNAVQSVGGLGGVGTAVGRSLGALVTGG